MPPPYGGIPKVSLLYAREWKKLGHEVGVMFVYRPEEADDLGAEAKYFFEHEKKPSKFDKLCYLIKHALSRPGLFISLVREYADIYPRLDKEGLLYAAYGAQVDGVLEEFRPNVVLGEATLVKTFMAAKTAQRRHIPVVFDTYAEVCDSRMGVNKHLDDEGRKNFWIRYLSLAELVIGISNCTAGAQKYLPPEKVKKFHDTCDFTLCRMEFAGDRSDWRKDLGLPKEKFLIGAVGAFEHRKGHHHLIQAAAVAIKKGLDIGIVICGGSGDPGKWKELSRSEGIEERLFILEKISEYDLAKLYRSLDLYANLSNSPRSCGLDLALTEAMASSLPIMVYDNGGLAEAVVDSKNGWVIKTDDIAGVVEVIEAAYAMDREELHRMGIESWKEAEKYDIRKTAQIKLGWLMEVVEKCKLS
jgi:glycosyltransferase involved in cell wall biosynthesis